MKRIALLFTFITTPLLANPCLEMESDYKVSCQERVIACNELETCKEVRNSCNTNVSTHEGCNNFMACVSNHFKKQTEDRSCLYEWSGQPSDQNKCENMNYRDIHTVAQECPGFKVFAGQFNDDTFTCEGHTKRYEKTLASCEEARNNLKRYCNIDKPAPETCESLKTAVVIDNEVPTLLAKREVTSGSRSEQTIYEFTSLREKLNNYTRSFSSSSAK